MAAGRRKGDDQIFFQADFIFTQQKRYHFTHPEYMI
jgi:hypothetical protein